MKAKRLHYDHVKSPVLLALACVLLLAADVEPVVSKTAPDFVLDLCVGADTLSLSDFEAYPVLLLLFDAGDMASSLAYRYVRNWNMKYPADELVTIGIHCPSFEPLTIGSNAVTAVSRAQLGFPVALDMDRKVCMKYRLESLPAFVLIKPGGEIAFQTSDPEKYRTVEEVIQKVIRDIEPDAAMPFLFQPKSGEYPPDAKILHPTPEITLGLSSGAIDGCDSTCLDRYKLYTDSLAKQKGRIYLHGRWKVEQDALAYQEGEESYIRVVYSGKDVWILRGFQSDEPTKVYVRQDRSYLKDDSWGKDIRMDATGRPYIHMRYAVPTHVVSNSRYGTHELQLIPTEGDMVFYYLFFDGTATK